jgi:hypothetical protein
MLSAITCTSCNRPLRVPETVLGQRVQCPLCLDEIVAQPDAASSAEAAAREAAAARRRASRAAPPPAASEETKPVLVLTLADDEPAKVAPPAAVQTTVKPTAERKPLVFPVIVSRDPDRILRGRMDAELTGDGLYLRRPRSSPAFAALGAPARYLGGPRFVLTVEGREVEVTVVKPGSSINHLAKDTVEYLNGRGPLPEAHAYRLPWYLFVLPAAAVLLPVVGIAGQVLLEGVPGGFLWVFLGGLTAGAAFIVAKQSWLRPGGRLIGATGVLGLAGLGLLVAVILNAVLPSPYAIDSTAWKTFSPPSGGYSVSMPGTPLRGRPTGFGGPNVADQSESYSVELKPQQCIFMVRQEPLNNVGLGGGGNANQAINNAFNQLQLNNSYGSYSYYNAFLLQRNVPVAAPSGGGQGRDVLYKVTNSHDGTRWLAARIFVSGDKLYTLTALGPKFYDDMSGKPNADVTRFFNSFQIVTRPSTKVVPSSPRELVPGPIAFWSLGNSDVRGGDAVKDFDDAGNPRRSIFHRTASTDGPPGKGNAAHFLGVDSWIDYGDAPDLNFAAGAGFTFTGWVRVGIVTRAGVLVSQRNSENEAPLIDLTMNEGKLVAEVRTDKQPLVGALRAESKPINDGQWHHFALIRHVPPEFEKFERARLDLFGDGALAASSNGEARGAITTNMRALGSERFWMTRNFGLYAWFDGDLDDFGIFNRALTESEIKKLAGVAP